MISSIEELKKEWESGQYGTPSECPSFKIAYTYKEALNVLMNGPAYVDETESKGMIEEDLYLENFWKHKKQ